MVPTSKNEMKNCFHQGDIGNNNNMLHKNEKHLIFLEDRKKIALFVYCPIVWLLEKKNLQIPKKI